MVQTGHWLADRDLSQGDVLEMLKARFKSINVKAAKEDVAPFLKDPHELDLWSMEFFLAAANRLRTVF
jgi:hypothetical protein